MLNSLQKRSLAHFRIRESWKAGILALAVLVPAQAMAQQATCNPDLDFTITTPGSFQLGQTLRVSANLGAGDIVGGTYQDIYAFGYALNCQPGQNFQNCVSEGNTVEFLGNLTTNCKNSQGQPAELNFPETNVIPITAVDYPIRTGPNQQCNVQFDMRVVALAPDDDNIVRQAMGWPLEGFPPTKCSNGLTSVASSTVSFSVLTPVTLVPGIDIEKATNGQDADNPTGPQIVVGDPVTWTYVVTNTGTAPLSNVSVSDSDLGAVTCPKTSLAPSESMTCTANGTATVGQYANTGTATGFYNDASVQDSDDSHYYGVEADIMVDKSIVNVTDNEDGTLDVTYEVTVTNNGDTTGTYDLVDTLMVDEALTATSVVNQVSYVAGSENDNSGTLGTPSVGDFSTGATLVTDEDLAAGEDESFRFTIRFSIDGTETTVEGANCEIDDDNGTNTGLTNYVEVLVDDEVVDDADACDPFPLTPDIQIVKEISIDNGETWVDSAGPVQAPSGALYRLTVSNTGNIDLQTVTVTDPLLGDPNVVYYTFGPLLVGADPTVITSGEWAVLDVAQVCGAAGNFTNTATATGSWEDPPANPGDTVSDTDQASLQCIGPPLIEIVKKVCLPNGEGYTCHDANDEPYPIVVYDPQNPVAAYYEITVKNIGTVPLVNVTIDDPDFGIEDYLIGNLAVDASVVIDDEDILALGVQSICGGLGEVANTASATGESAAGVEDTDSDSATVNCVGQPDIDVVKEVSLDGVNWEDVSVSTFPTADAYYRIRVTNTGSVDLVNVTVVDDDLLINELIGSLDVGDSVTLVPQNAGVDEVVVEDLYIPNFCDDTAFEYVNTALASGDAALGGSSVNASDSATYNCLERFDICENGGRPNVLKMEYDADDDSFNEQGASFVATPVSVEFPATPITIKTFNSQDLGTPLNVFENMSEGDMFFVEDTSSSGKIPPNIVIEFWDGSTLLQTIQFHGSCSAPLNIGDEYSAATVIGAVYYTGATSANLRKSK